MLEEYHSSSDLGKVILGSVHHGVSSIRVEKRSQLLSDFTLYSERSVGYLREVELSEHREGFGNVLNGASPHMG